MKDIMKGIVTLLMIMWFLGSIMFIAGEPINGSQIENAILGFVSLGLCSIIWKELERRGIITDKK
jgi:membrane associated rhomboid family serine protease